MEYFDICDENGTPTGETVSRKTAHEKGICHRTAHVWIVRRHDSHWDLLLQKRSLNKDSFPGCLDTSSAGHIPAGDEPLDSALRELEEELGISAVEADLVPIGKFHAAYEMVFHDQPFKDNEVVFVYILKKEVEISDITVQKEELTGVEWHSLEETEAAVAEDDPAYCVPPLGLACIASYLRQKDC